MELSIRLILLIFYSHLLWAGSGKKKKDISLAELFKTLSVMPFMFLSLLGSV